MLQKYKSTQLTETSAVKAVLDGYVNFQFGDAEVKLLAFIAITGMLNSSFPLSSANLTMMKRSFNTPSHVNIMRVPPVMVPDVGCKL